MGCREAAGYLFLQVVEAAVRERGSVHLLVRLGVALAVPVHALVADVVLHGVPLPLSVLHQLLHLDQVDGGGVARAVAPPQGQVLRLVLPAHAAGRVPLVVAEGRAARLAQVQRGVHAVPGPPPRPRLLPPRAGAGAGHGAGAPARTVRQLIVLRCAVAGERRALVAAGLGREVAQLVARLGGGEPLVRGRGGRVGAAPPVPAGQVGGGGGGRDAHAGRQLVRGGQPAHLEALRGLDEAGELRLGHGGLALVHEVEDALHLPAAHVLQHHDGVLAGVVHEDLLEVGAAGGQHDLVGADRGVFAHDSAVHQGFILRIKLIRKCSRQITVSELSPEEDCRMQRGGGSDGCSTAGSSADCAPCLCCSGQHHLQAGIQSQISSWKLIS